VALKILSSASVSPPIPYPLLGKTTPLTLGAEFRYMKGTESSSMLCPQSQFLTASEFIPLRPL
jgi:hypothetical protein